MYCTCSQERTAPTVERPPCWGRRLPRPLALPAPIAVCAVAVAAEADAGMPRPPPCLPTPPSLPPPLPLSRTLSQVPSPCRHDHHRAVVARSSAPSLPLSLPRRRGKSCIYWLLFEHRSEEAAVEVVEAVMLPLLPLPSKASSAARWQQNPPPKQFPLHRDRSLARAPAGRRATKNRKREG